MNNKKPYNTLDINNLFPSGKKCTGKLNVNNLFDEYIKHDDKPKLLDVKDVVEKEKLKKKEIFKTYRLMLKECLELFTYYNKYGHKDFIYEIRPIYGSVLIEDMEECKNYLIKKLEKNYLDTYPLKDRFIFITWINIDNNIKKHKEKKEKNKKK